jgi:hypothetical protein
MSETKQAPQAGQTMTITVGDQSFRVRVTPDLQTRYERSAKIANEAIEQARAGGALGGPRTLAMALFQLAVELDEARQTGGSNEAGRERLRQLIDRIDQATESTNH